VENTQRSRTQARIRRSFPNPHTGTVGRQGVHRPCRSLMVLISYSGYAIYIFRWNQRRIIILIPDGSRDSFRNFGHNHSVRKKGSRPPFLSKGRPNPLSSQDRPYPYLQKKCSRVFHEELKIAQAYAMSLVSSLVRSLVGLGKKVPIGSRFRGNVVYAQVGNITRARTLIATRVVPQIWQI
jgi:hypothetical protein